MTTSDFDHSQYRTVYLCSDGLHSREFPSVELLTKFVDQYRELFPDHSFDLKFYELRIYSQFKI